MLYRIQFVKQKKKPLPTSAGQQAAMIDAANLRRCFEWKASDRTKQAGILARRSAPFRPSHGSPQWHIRIGPCSRVTSSLRLYLIPFLYFICQIKANMVICFDSAGNIHPVLFIFNKNQYIILRRNWQSCFYKFSLVYFFV